jgi:hypothetical protein
MIGPWMLLAAAALGSDGGCAPPQVGQPLQAVIGDEHTAKQVAEIYLAAIYGEEEIKPQLPLRASLIDGVWHVKGKERGLSVGGTSEIHLCRSSGQVLWVLLGE